MTHLIPSFLKNHGINNRNITSDIWPKVILKAGSLMFAVFRNTGT